MPWSKRLLLVCVVLGVLSLVVSADKEGESVQANAAETSTAAAKVDETTAPMLQQLFRESAGLLRMKAKLSQDYMHDPAITRLYKDARRENSIALQRARLLSAHAVAQPMKNMMGFMHAYMPVMPDEVLMHKRHKDKEEEEEEDEEEDDSKDKKKHKKKDKKEKEEEEEKEKEEEKKKQEEEEADQKEEEEAEHKKMQKADKKTLPDMEDLLAELMLRREKHPVGTKERDELNMEIDELLSHIDRAKGGDGHDRHELEKEDDHVKALEQEHANDLVMYKEAQAGLPIDEPNAYVNHHLDKLLNHIQTLRRSADGLGGLTLQELSELEVEARALLLDLEEYRGEKVDTRLLKIELDPKLGHVRRKQLLLAEARTRQMRQQQQIERERQDHEIEEQLRANELKEYVGKIQSDTRAVERLHDQHERLLEERARAATAREREQLDQEAMVLERQLDSARYQLAKDESDMDRIAATHDLHQLRRLTDPISTSLDLPLNRVQVVHEIVDDRVPSLAHLGAIGTDSPIAVVRGSRSLGIPVSSLLSSTNGKIEPFVRMPMPGEPVDGGVQAETVVDACGKCHTVFVSCQKRCSVDSCAPNLCDTQRSACAQSSNCSGLNINSNNLVVASTMQRVQSCSSGSC